MCLSVGVGGRDGRSLGLNNNFLLFFATIKVHCRTLGEKSKNGKERGKINLAGSRERSKGLIVKIQCSSTRWQITIPQSSRTGVPALPLSLIPQGTAIPQQKAHCYVSFYHTPIGEQTSWKSYLELAECYGLVVCWDGCRGHSIHWSEYFCKKRRKEEKKIWWSNNRSPRAHPRHFVVWRETPWSGPGNRT